MLYFHKCLHGGAHTHIPQTKVIYLVYACVYGRSEDDYQNLRELETPTPYIPISLLLFDLVSMDKYTFNRPPLLSYQLYYFICIILGIGHFYIKLICQVSVSKEV